MEKKNRPMDLVCAVVYGLLAVFWFTTSFPGVPNEGANFLRFCFGIAFSILCYLNLRRYWRNRREKS